MPTYQYACTDCGDRTEVVQKFTDDPLSVCVTCGGRLRKIFSPVGIVFKGSGFYRNDSRAGAKDGKPAADKAVNGDSAAAAKSDSGSSAGEKSAGEKSAGDKSGAGQKADKAASSSSSGSPSSGSSSSGSSSSSSGSKVA